MDIGANLPSILREASTLRLPLPPTVFTPSERRVERLVVEYADAPPSARTITKAFNWTIFFYCGNCFSNSSRQTNFSCSEREREIERTGLCQLSDSPRVTCKPCKGKAIFKQHQATSIVLPIVRAVHTYIHTYRRTGQLYIHTYTDVRSAWLHLTH